LVAILDLKPCVFFLLLLLGWNVLLAMQVILRLKLKNNKHKYLEAEKQALFRKGRAPPKL
jgi:hypothetical protein